jgi:hypothetical protein
MKYIDLQPGAGMQRLMCTCGTGRTGAEVHKANARITELSIPLCKFAAKLIMEHNLTTGRSKLRLEKLWRAVHVP